MGEIVGRQQPSVITHRDPDAYRWVAFAGLMAATIFATLHAFTEDGPHATLVRIWIAPFTLAGAFFAWRCLKIGSIRVQRRGIREAGFFRDHFWAWEDLDRVAVEVLVPPWKAVKMRSLVVYPKAGEPYFAWYTIASPKKGESSWVDVAAGEINRQLAAHRVGNTGG